MRHGFRLSTRQLGAVASSRTSNSPRTTSSDSHPGSFFFKVLVQKLLRLCFRTHSLPDAEKAKSDFWSMTGYFICRHHVEPRVKLHSPREESFSIPLKYIDVSRTTKTNWDVMQERRIDDCWNIDGSRDLSDSWIGFTQFTLLDEKPPDGCVWSGGT